MASESPSISSSRSRLLPPVPVPPGWRDVKVLKQDTLETLYQKAYAPDAVLGGERQLALWFVAYHGAVPKAGERLRLPPLSLMNEQIKAALVRMTSEHRERVVAQADELVRDGITLSAHRKLRKEVQAQRAALAGQAPSLATPSLAVGATAAASGGRTVGVGGRSGRAALESMLKESIAEFRRVPHPARMTLATWLGTYGPLHDTDWRPFVSSYRTLDELRADIAKTLATLDAAAGDAATDVVVNALVTTIVATTVWRPVRRGLEAELKGAAARLTVLVERPELLDMLVHLLSRLDERDATTLLSGYGLADAAATEMVSSLRECQGSSAATARAKKHLLALAQARLSAVDAVQRDLDLMWQTPERALSWAPAFTRQVLDTASVGLDARAYPFAATVPQDAAQEAVVTACRAGGLGLTLGQTFAKSMTAIGAEQVGHHVGLLADVAVNGLEAAIRGYRAAVVSQALAAASLGEGQSVGSAVLRAVGAEAVGLVVGKLAHHATGPLWERLLGSGMGASALTAGAALLDKFTTLGVEHLEAGHEQHIKAAWLEHQRLLGAALIAESRPLLEREFGRRLYGDSSEFTAMFALFVSLYGAQVQRLQASGQLAAAFLGFATPLMVASRRRPRE